MARLKAQVRCGVRHTYSSRLDCSSLRVCVALFVACVLAVVIACAIALAVALGIAPGSLRRSSSPALDTALWSVLGVRQRERRGGRIRKREDEAREQQPLARRESHALAIVNQAEPPVGE